MSRYFIPGPDPVPQPGGNDRRGMDLLEEYFQAVGENYFCMAVVHGVMIPVEAGIALVAQVCG